MNDKGCYVCVVFGYISHVLLYLPYCSPVCVCDFLQLFACVFVKYALDLTMAFVIQDQQDNGLEHYFNDKPESTKTDSLQYAQCQKSVPVHDFFFTFYGCHK